MAKTIHDMNAKIKKNAKKRLQKKFFKLMNNADFGKTMENMRTYRYIKPVTAKARRNYLVSEPNY